jgi:outer membrane protein assembly factor BamB
MLLVLILLPMGCKRKNRPPTTPTTPQGAVSTYTLRSESYTTEATDPDNNAVIRYIWDWADTNIDTTTENTGFHSWVNAGSYAIKVKAIDEKGLESGWSEVLSVLVQYNSPPTLNSISGPTIGLINKNFYFSIVAYDSTDSVRVQFLRRNKKTLKDTVYSWQVYKPSGSTFGDSIKFATNDTYIIRAIAQDKKGSLSDTSSPHTVIFFAPRIDTVSGPTIGWLNQFCSFSTVARDTVDSVYVRFIYRKNNTTSYTTRPEIGPKASGSVFTDLIQFTTMDSYVIRAIARNKQGTKSDTSLTHKIYIAGWAFSPEDIPFNGSPALVEYAGELLIAIGAGDGGDGYFYLIKASDGTEKYKKKSIWDPDIIPNEPEDIFYTSPAVNTYFSPPHIYCGGESGELYCYNTGSGSSWEWHFPDSSYEGLTYNEVCGSVAVSGTRLYVGMNPSADNVNDYRLYAIQDNGLDCSIAWSYYIGSEIHSSPAIDASGNIYFGDDSGYVTCLTSSGTKTWRRRIGTGVYDVYSSIAIAADGIYVGTDDGFMYKLNAATGNQIWKYPTTTALEGVRSSPVIGTDGTVYFGGDDGNLYAVTSSGQLQDSIFLSDGAITSTPTITSDGTIIVTTEEDMVYGINSNFTIKWQVPLPGFGFKKSHFKSRFTSKGSRLLDDIFPSPTVGPDGTIYVASYNGGLYALKGNTTTLANSVWPKFRHDLKNTGKYGTK